jgi:hypothetical protein
VEGSGRVVAAGIATKTATRRRRVGGKAGWGRATSAYLVTALKRTALMTTIALMTRMMAAGTTTSSSRVCGSDSSSSSGSRRRRRGQFKIAVLFAYL